MSIISKGLQYIRTPRKLKSRQTKAKGNQQRFKSEVVEKRGQRIPLSNSATDTDCWKRVTVVHDVGCSRSKGMFKDLPEGGRHAKSRKNGREIFMADAIVGFFLIEKEENTVDVMVGCVVENLSETHSNIRSVAATSEASLIRMDESRKKRR